MYAELAGIELHCNIHIVKNIPVAAGMGGGSSNAATVLNILNRHFNKLNASDLSELALGLGADVPFFLNPHLSSATGVGEKLVPVSFDYEKIPMVIVAPHFPVSAAWAYKHCSVADDAEAKGQMTEILDAVRSADLNEVAKLMRNDLAIPLYGKFPILSIIKQQILDTGALCAEVTGSGPTLFGIFESEQVAAIAADTLRAELPDSMTVWNVN